MRTICSLLAISMLLAGCAQQQSQQQQNQQQSQQQPQQQSKQQSKTQSAAQDPMCKKMPVRHFDAEQKAKSITQKVKGIDKSVAVQIDNDLNVAIQVSNFNRFRLETIEKEVAQKLKKSFPKTKIHVTSDKKLINELQKLSDSPWYAKMEAACKQKKKLKKIEDDMKG
ncbi:YhcN/YlaJ family sporulation lipoprotein [Brevibacillus composti]|nr:YhcN/YlaJ family sporulation lipoprotein [Brevibacillus composti]